MPRAALQVKSVWRRNFQVLAALNLPDAANPNKVTSTHRLMRCDFLLAIGIAHHDCTSASSSSNRASSSASVYRTKGRENGGEIVGGPMGGIAGFSVECRTINA